MNKLDDPAAWRDESGGAPRREGGYRERGRRGGEAWQSRAGVERKQAKHETQA